MGKPRRPSCAMAVVAAAVLAQAAAAQEKADQWHFDGVRFPAAVDTFVVRGVDRWPDDPRLGVVVRYVTPMSGNGVFDVYIYPIGEGRGTLSDSASAAAEFHEAMEEISEYNELRGQGVTLEVEEEGPKLVDGLVGQESRYVLRRGSQARESRLIVFAKAGRYFKYRMTYERSIRQIMEGHVANFVEGTLASVSAEPVVQPEESGVFSFKRPFWTGVAGLAVGASFATLSCDNDGMSEVACATAQTGLWGAGMGLGIGLLWEALRN